MRPGLLVILIVATFAGATEEEIFELGRRRPTEVIVAIDDAPLPTPFDETQPPMALRLQGVLAVWRGRELGALLGAVPRDPRPVGVPSDADVVCVLHLVYGRAVGKRVRIVRTGDGTIVAHEIDLGEDGEQAVVELDRLAAAEIFVGVDQFRGDYDHVDAPRGVVARLEGDAVPGWFTFDQQLIDARIASPSIRMAPSMRFVEDEGFHIRLPAGYDPRTPAGLLVWISPTPNGPPPQVFAKALDSLNLICIGADNSGNDRAPEDRFQLAFDAMATVMRRFHVDPRRVYVTGFSGGGRMASMTHGAFADVVSGSIPLGGANAYKNVPIGDGRYWPAGYRKPGGRLFSLFRRQRMACVTGSRDFNYDNVQGVVRILKRDGVNAEVFDVEGLAHVLPDADSFLEAAIWIDEPYQHTRAEEIDEARQAMQTYRQRFGDAPVADDGQRRLLHMVMHRGPWTPEAWEAAAILGLAPNPDRQEGDAEPDLRTP